MKALTRLIPFAGLLATSSATFVTQAHAAGEPVRLDEPSGLALAVVGVGVVAWAQWRQAREERARRALKPALRSTSRARPSGLAGDHRSR